MENKDLQPLNKFHYHHGDGNQIIHDSQHRAYLTEKDFFDENKTDQSGDIAPIINKAEVKNSSDISPDWQERFDEEFGRLVHGDGAKLLFDNIKSFIAKEIKLAEERGGAKMAETIHHGIKEIPEQIRQESRHALIEEAVEEIERKMKGINNLTRPYESGAWDGFTTAIEIIKGME